MKSLKRPRAVRSGHRRSIADGSAARKPKLKRRKPCTVFTRSYPNGVLVIEVRDAK